MMTKAEILDLLNQTPDITIHDHQDTIRVIVEDFDGFDGNWDEILVAYDEEAIERMEDTLVDHANTYGWGEYVFDEVTVKVTYASDDI